MAATDTTLIGRFTVERCMRTADEYARYARAGFLLGLGLFVIGGLGALVIAPRPSTPAWEVTLFVDMEIAGVLIGFLAPLVFGVVLPLTE